MPLYIIISLTIVFLPVLSHAEESFVPAIAPGKAKTCDTGGLVLPAAEYDHDEGCSVTGGFVYRGRAMPALDGIYLYGDYCSGRIWGMKRSGGKWISSLLADTDLSISSFGEDEAGEVYVADHDRGAIFMIEAAAGR